jgi:hypothetical protein
MSEGLIECFYATPGSVLKPSDKILDLSVNLSNNFAQDCPPISFYRVVIREKLVLREIRVPRGQGCKVNDVIVVFSNDAEEPLDQPAQRGIRCATVGIIHHPGLWTWNNQ